MDQARKLEEFLKDIKDKPSDGLVTDFNTAFPVRARDYTPLTTDNRVLQYDRSKELRRGILETKIPFISGSFYPDFYLRQGLILVGGCSGHGKSTVAANVIHGFLETTKDDECIIITNEESTDAILDRISCIMHKENYKDVYSGRMNSDKLEEIENTSRSISRRVEVIEDGQFQPSIIEDVVAILENAAKRKVKLVVVDYLQTINQSRKDPEMDSFRISKEFGFYLKDYGKKYGVPVVCFAQLNPKSISPDFQSRVQNDKTIYNHAFVTIEVVPNFETGITTFHVHKDRFCSAQGKEVQMRYIHGRYEIEADNYI